MENEQIKGRDYQTSRQEKKIGKKVDPASFNQLFIFMLSSSFLLFLFWTVCLFSRSSSTLHSVVVLRTMCVHVPSYWETRSDKRRRRRSDQRDNTHNSCRKWNFQECPESCWNCCLLEHAKGKKRKRVWLGQRIIIYRIGTTVLFLVFLCVFFLHSPNDSRRVLLLAYRLYM